MTILKRMRLKTPKQDFIIELNDTETADSIWYALPFEAYANCWGDEIYFEVPVKMPLERGKRVMEVGEVAFWPDGSALCFFFGPTPVSDGDRPVAYSDVTPVGMIIEEATGLKKVGDRSRLTVERA